FCDTVCFYCACNKVVTKDRTRAGGYLERLHKEIAMQGALFDQGRTVDQLHWGGGTPTFISHQEMEDLMRVTGEHFNLRDDDTGEYSIEIDPREVSEETIAVLRRIGFNRMSMGVQDFDPKVQAAVNRNQTERQTMAALEAARREGFKSMSLDLIYGLPFQSVESFQRTLEKVLTISPDRLSIFNYAHLPELFKPQRRIDADDLPAPQEKLDILQTTIETLTANGYVYIGMDHFAKPDDELAVAQRDGTLYRNFQGYSTHSDCDLIGMGNTAISMVGSSYAQSFRELDEYYERIDNGRLAIFRGVELDADDVLRRDVITRFICHFHLDKATVAKAHGIDFDQYFENELKDLAEMEGDGLLTVNDAAIQVEPAGKLLIRNICMVFDRYLREKGGQRFSKVI
ncbi:MAG TPA: oxygen-independent coproporphyrinogen III oxidase, partial [Gammaproteobacteria bacterium]|nr:oxygen-independent coproporphyrinogen III oxidase [Gammaproteobacteria bacterium]